MGNSQNQEVGEEENFETQSGDGSNQDEPERESGDEDHSGVLPTLSEINTNEPNLDKVVEPTPAEKVVIEQKQLQTQAKEEVVVKVVAAATEVKKEPQFEEESKVLENDDVDDSVSEEAKSVTTAATN